jgi:Flp pilus assembly protein TadD
VNKKLNKYDKAIELLESVTKSIDPKDASAYNNLANIYCEQSKFEVAALLYLQALEIEPNDDDTLCNLGLIL